VAKKLGNDYRLWIESATPGTYNEIKGGQELSVSRSAATIDTSTKDDFPYGTSAPGMRQLSVPFSIIPNLPDATGYTRFETVANAATATPTNFQIRKGGSAATADRRRSDLLDVRHRFQHRPGPERRGEGVGDARCSGGADR
jgi:hypothetical protein